MADPIKRKQPTKDGNTITRKKKRQKRDLRGSPPWEPLF